MVFCSAISEHLRDDHLGVCATDGKLVTANGHLDRVTEWSDLANSDLNPFTKWRIRSCGLKHSWVAYGDNARNLASYVVTDILPCSRLKNSSLFLSLKVSGIYFSINKLENDAQVIGGASVC